MVVKDAPPAKAGQDLPSVRELDADVQLLRRRLPTLEAVERRRGHLWTVAAILLLAASATVLLLLLVPEAAEVVPDIGGLRLGFVVVSLAFLLYVFDQERRMRRLSGALIDERVLTSVLEERVRDLSTLSRVGQVVNSVLTTEEVLLIILEGAHELTGSMTGSVLLVDGDELVVEVSSGEAAAPRGARQSLDEGVAGEVARTREPMLIVGEVGEDVPGRRPRRRGGGSSVVAPMVVGADLIGVLSLERTPDAERFTQWDLRAVALFANHAATAVTNAKRYESERYNVSRLADMIERRSEFVATLVHDLKTPLSSIVGFSQLLSRHGERVSAEQRPELLARIEVASQDLLAMVDDILRSASLEAAVPIRPEPIDVGEFVADIVDATRSMALSRDGVERPIELEAPTQLLLHTDPGALRSILQNLLENAVKYSPPGSPITMQVEPLDKEVRFSVGDRGQGIPSHERDVIFERFRRSANAGSDGVGLGLYIVRSLVVAHGGRIGVDESPEGGSIFRVTLPDRRGASHVIPDTTAHIGSGEATL